MIGLAVALLLASMIAPIMMATVTAMEIVRDMQSDRTMISENNSNSWE